MLAGLSAGAGDLSIQTTTPKGKHMETQELTLYEREAERDANHWLAEADRIVIDDADTAQAAADFLNEDLAARQKAVEDFFAPLVAAVHATHKALTQKRAAIVARLEEPMRVVKAKLNAWEAQRRELRSIAEKAAGAANLLVVPEDQKIDGVAFVKTVRAEVTDFPALLKATVENEHLRPLVQPNQKAITALAKALGLAMNVPGITVVEEASVRRTA